MAPQSNLLGTYSPEDVIITIGNDNFSHILSGYVDGTFITITRVVDHSTPYVGADKTNARVVRSVKNCDITLTLHQTSESNDVLSQLLTRDETSRDGSDLFYITIKDTRGRTVASSPVCYIVTNPDSDFGTDIAERAWGLHAINMTHHTGGNAKFSNETYETVTDLGYTPDTFWNPNA